jgi:hypothetical protein
LIREGAPQGWAMRTDIRGWVTPVALADVGAFLSHHGYAPADIKVEKGYQTRNPWEVVSEPFQPEYPRDKVWNRNACQLEFAPSKSDKLATPTWDRIFKHVGQSLDPELAKHPWAKEYEITTGDQYLELWVSSMLQNPFTPLPYLFLYGSEASGKSMLHEAISLLFSREGTVRADQALLSKGNFNGEIEGAVLCTVEEVDLSKGGSKRALNRIKDWLLARYIAIHRKGATPYSVLNCTHWIQCANYISYCPLFTGDTRITILSVPPITELVNKELLVARLKEEAPDFLAKLFRKEIPPATGRLGIPVIEIAAKSAIQDLNRPVMEEFLAEQCCFYPGGSVSLSHFGEEFRIFAGKESDEYHWATKRIAKELLTSQRALDAKVVKGRSTKASNAVYLGNISLEPGTATDPWMVSGKGVLTK